MAGNHGAFCWYELMTTDMAAAASYYAQVVGWDAAPMPATVVHYTRFLAGSVPVAGVMDLPPELREMKIPPHWGAYVAVDDVDATAAHAVALGGTVAWGPMDIQDIGRFASLRDPQGAHLGIMRGTLDIPAPHPRPRDPGFGSWRELMSDDPEAGLAFYAALFGWQKTTPIDMGPMGTYQLFGREGEDLGGMMRRPEGVPSSAWSFYFSVPSVQAATPRVAEAGGQVMRGPMPVPGGQWIIQTTDPQGAFVSLVSWEP